MDKSLYSRRSNLVIGFHGCDKTVVDAVVAGKTNLLSSTNDYDWLGNGIYFWENNEERAWQWAKDLAKRKNSQIKEPAVVGAIIDLGYCFDLTDSTYLQELKAAYESMVTVYKESGIELGFREKNHIQICVCNPNCIKGYFLPRGINQDYPNP